MPGGSWGSSTAAATTPAARPGRPTWTAATAEPSVAASITGVQSATMAARASPGVVVTTASAVTVAVLAASTVTVGGRTFPTREAFELVYLIGVIAAAIGVVLITLIPGRRTAPTTQGRAPAPLTR